MTWMSKEQILTAMRQILHYKKHYYAGKPLVPDVVYDAVEDELRRNDPNNPVLDLVGYDETYEEIIQDWIAYAST